MAMSLLKRNAPTAPHEPALTPIERVPEFSAILAKREALRQRLADCEAERFQLSAIVPSAKVYDLEVERLISNPAMALEDHDARSRRERLEVIEREREIIRRALESIEGQLVQTRGRLSGQVRDAHLALCHQDVRHALAAALRLRFIDGQRSARISLLAGHGYQIGGLPTVSFSQPWGALGDIQSHWQTVLRELRDAAIVSPQEFAQITSGIIPATLEGGA